MVAGSALRGVSAGFAVLVALSVAVYLISPFGVGQVVQTAVILGIVAAGISRVLAVATEPRWPWYVLCLGCLLLGVSVILRLVSSAMVFGLPVSTVSFLVAYAVCFTWLMIVTAQVTGRRAGGVLIDTAAASAGLLLAMATAAFATGVEWTLPNVTLGIYPIINIACLIPAAHLALHIGRAVPAWYLMTAGTALQTALDTSTFFLMLNDRLDQQFWVVAGYPVVYLLVGSAVLHPSIRHTASVASTRTGLPSLIRLAPVLGGVALAIVSILVTNRNVSGGEVQTALVVFLLALLVVRIVLTLRAQTTAEGEALYRLDHDPLTGLYNRSAFVAQLPNFLAEDDRGRRTAVVRADLENFRQFNDAWGHPVGDRLLVQAARNLSRLAGPGRLVARHAGDEFVVLTHVGSEKEALVLAHTVRHLMGGRVQVSPRHVEEVRSSVSVALAPAGYRGDHDALLMWSEAAMAEAKARGGAVVFYDEALDEQIRRRAALADALRRAVARETISVAFQPIHGGPGFRDLLGWEALARWEDPVLGVVPPSVFIPLAEEEGLICELGDAVLRRALVEFAALRAAHEAIAPFCSVNVSAPQLQQSGFARTVAEALETAGLPPECLRLEITESLIVGDDTVPMSVLDALRESGVAIALDDFGTGYASITTLRRLSLDCVKLDRSLISRLDEDPQATAQVRAILDLVAALGIESVVAEGVETEQQARVLLDLACGSVQGWWSGRPLSGGEILKARTRPQPAPVVPDRDLAELRQQVR